LIVPDATQREPIERVAGVSRSRVGSQSRLQLTAPGRLAAALVLAVLVAGCTTAYSRGAEAFRAGRYDEAAREFEAAAEAGTKRLEALTGLGIARYKIGNFAGAADALRPVLAEEPRRGEARLYLALAELGQEEDTRALEHLQAVRPLIHHPRILATVDRAMAAIRGGLPGPARQLVAASLDDAVEWARDVWEARERAPGYVLEPSWTIYRDLYYPRLP
jgi:tetratricopeptide (TPR) repeat protein